MSYYDGTVFRVDTAPGAWFYIVGTASLISVTPAHTQSVQNRIRTCGYRHENVIAILPVQIPAQSAFVKHNVPRIWIGLPAARVTAFQGDAADQMERSGAITRRLAAALVWFVCPLCDADGVLGLGYRQGILNKQECGTP